MGEKGILEVACSSLRKSVLDTYVIFVMDGAPVTQK